MDDDDRQLADFCASAYPQLVGALAHHTGDLLLAEELAQEALLRVCRKWSHVRSLASPVGWAYRVGVNLAASAFRRRSAERRANQRASMLGRRSDEPATSEYLAVRQALDGLSDAQRQAVLLRYYFGLSAEETAAVTNRTSAAVRSLTHRAVKLLRVELDISAPETSRPQEVTDVP